ncbi:hypothetical protein K501DRAFT_273160 [Backusella circina FSU 941]|nr:hypothetical protein K501DRAFT_273160 [Backusella circina FSU 941]
MSATNILSKRADAPTKNIRLGALGDTTFSVLTGFENSLSNTINDTLLMNGIMMPRLIHLIKCRAIALMLLLILSLSFLPNTVLPLSIYRMFEKTAHHFEKICAPMRG